jgi:hypothetical protein
MEKRRHYAGNHIAGLLDDDRVPFAQILSCEILGVMQGRH